MIIHQLQVKMILKMIRIYNLLRQGLINLSNQQLIYILISSFHMLDKTKFNKYLDPNFIYINHLKPTTLSDPIDNHLYELYNLLIKNGCSDKKKRLLTKVTEIIQNYQKPLTEKSLKKSTKYQQSTINSFNNRECSVLIKQQVIKTNMLPEKLNYLKQDLKSNFNRNNCSDRDIIRIKQGLRIYICHFINSKKKTILYEVVAKSFGYKFHVSKNYLSNIYEFDDFGPYRFSAELNKADGTYVFLKEQIMYAVEGQNAEQVLKNNSQIMGFDKSCQSNNSFVDGFSNEDSDYFQQSTIYDKSVIDKNILLNNQSKQFNSEKNQQNDILEQQIIFNNNQVPQKQQQIKISKIRKSRSFSEVYNLSPTKSKEQQLGKSWLSKQIIHEEESQEHMETSSHTEKSECEDILSLNENDEIYKKQRFETKDGDSSNMENSGKSQKNQFLRGFLQIRIQNGFNKQSLLKQSKYLHPNWHQKVIQIQLSQQQKIQPLGYELKRSKKLSNSQKNLTLLNQIDDSINQSRKLKRKRSKSFQLQDQNTVLHLKQSLYKSVRRQKWDQENLIDFIVQKLAKRTQTQ